MLSSPPLRLHTPAVSRPCHFCGRWFGNKQGVRRHLGYCAEYQQSDSKRGGDLRRFLGLPPGNVATKRPAGGVCVECGAHSPSMGRCACGSVRCIPDELVPARCPRCRHVTATALAGWDGRCVNCGEAMSQAALRAERDALRRKLELLGEDDE
jgi:hypothetical protein